MQVARTMRAHNSPSPSLFKFLAIHLNLLARYLFFLFFISDYGVCLLLRKRKFISATQRHNDGTNTFTCLHKVNTALMKWKRSLSCDIRKMSSLVLIYHHRLTCIILYQCHGDRCRQLRFRFRYSMDRWRSLWRQCSTAQQSHRRRPHLVKSNVREKQTTEEIVAFILLVTINDLFLS